MLRQSSLASVRTGIFRRPRWSALSLRHTREWGIRQAPTTYSKLFFSSTSSTSSSSNGGSENNKNNNGGDNPNARLGRALYRQLLRWCHAIDAPHLFLDPQQEGDNNTTECFLLSPENGAIDKALIAKLLLVCESHEEKEQFRSLRALLPPPSRVDVVHSQVRLQVETPAHIELGIQLAFRLAALSDPSRERERLAMAFDTLKTLNQWTPAIQRKKQERIHHSDREGVLYHVGQVVQHATDRWRGVICGWSKNGGGVEDNTQNEEERVGKAGRRTSLTTKRYFDFVDNTEPKVYYDVIVDSGDALLLGGGLGTHSRKANETTGLPMVVQTQLQPISELRLLRIRSNWIPSKFRRYNPLTGTFVPKPTLAWEYPADDAATAAAASVAASEEEEEDNQTAFATMRPLYTSLEDSQSPRDEKAIAQDVVEGVQGVARRLCRCILDVTSCADSRNLRLLASLQRRLEKLSKNPKTTTTMTTMSDDDDDNNDWMAHAAGHLRSLLRITVELSEWQWQRRIAQNHNKKKNRGGFGLGTVVKHVKYGFRGVVIAWDPKPTVDVSHWDGLQDVENPGELAFYHVIPDQSDCRRAFGGERPFRYVCEANLMPCPMAECATVQVDLDPDEWPLDKTNWRFEAPEELKFKYGEDLGDDEELIVNCIHQMTTEIARLHKAIRDGISPRMDDAAADDDDDDDAHKNSEKLSLDNLFSLLRFATSLDHAVVIQETVKEVWKVHESDEMRWRLDDGIAELLRGHKDAALGIFSSLVSEDPAYLEAWNKKATCHFMRGEYQESAEAARRTLDLHPRHFQALNGLGLVQYETNRYRLAAESFRQALDMDPWSPVSSRLTLCLDQLKRMEAVVGGRAGRVGIDKHNHDDDEEDEEEGAREGTAPSEKQPH